MKRLIEESDNKIDSVKRESEAQRNKQSEVRDAAEKFTAIIDQENEQLTGIYKTKDQRREDFYKALYDFEVQNDFIRYVKGLGTQKQKIMVAAEDK